MFKRVDVHGVPLDLGANIRGSNMGPAAIRIAGLHDALKALDYESLDKGDIHAPLRELISEKDQTQKYLTSIAEACTELADRCERSIEEGALPLTLGGDHSFAMGSISGVSSAYRKKNQKIGLIWVDAHADLNTPTSSPSGNIHGMPLAAMLGYGHDELTKIKYSGAKVRPENVALIGIRCIDGKEKEMCRQSGIRYFSMREIDEKGMSQVMKEAIACATKDTAGIHVSFDLDAIEPIHAPGVSTPVSGGLSYREAHLCLESIADTGKLIAVDLVELNPMTDVHHQTANLSVELILSALGKSII